MQQIKSNDYKSVLQKQGILAFVPDGNSMWPFIKNGKQSVIVEIPKNPIKIYDVVFFTRSDGTQILHRVLGFDNDKLVVGGDSQSFTEVINPSDVFGVMTGFYKGKKYFSVEDNSYLKRVKKWCKNGFLTKLRKKLFNKRIVNKQK